MKKRDFLKTTGLLALGAFLPSPICGNEREEGRQRLYMEPPILLNTPKYKIFWLKLKGGVLVESLKG